MARGVQQEDVSLAADAVLKSGARPTVERVRKQMGRGSPNTVGPLLDIWFSQLGTRLGENPALLPSPSPAADVPLAVINASKLVWTTARTEAQREAAGAVAGDRQALATEREDLEQERSAFHASREAMEENIRLAQGQAADLRRQVDDLAERGRNADDQVAGRARSEASVASACCGTLLGEQIADQRAIGLFGRDPQDVAGQPSSEGPDAVRLFGQRGCCAGAGDDLALLFRQRADLGTAAVTALVAAVALGGQAFMQAPVPATPINELPNPYATIDGWAKLPNGRTWGSTSAVEIDKDGRSVWVGERCGANGCWDAAKGVMSPLPSVLKFDPSGALVTSFGAGMIVFAHGIHVDRDGNVYGGGTDGVIRKLSPDGTVTEFACGSGRRASMNLQSRGWTTCGALR